MRGMRPFGIGWRTSAVLATLAMLIGSVGGLGLPRLTTGADAGPFLVADSSARLASAAGDVEADRRCDRDTGVKPVSQGT
jgi:hypothetical protein